jgi:Flp pilus assembly protein TadB
MATVAAIAGVVTAVAAVAGTIEQRKQNRQINRERRLQASLSNRQQQVSRQRRRRQIIAQQRVQAAQIEQAGIREGITGSSIVAGTTGAIRTDVATSIGAGATQLAAQRGIAESQGREGDIRAGGNIFQDISRAAAPLSDKQFTSSVQNLFS